MEKFIYHWYKYIFMVFMFEKKVKTKYGTYIYLCLGHTKWINGKSKRTWEVTLGRKDQIEEILPMIKRKLSGSLPKPRVRAFGLIYGLYSISKELELSDIINKCVSKRKQGFSVGEYLTILVINRAVALNSKSRVQDWFNKTSLSRHFQGKSGALSPQNIWDQMSYLDKETIRTIEELICKKLFSGFQHQSDCFLFDPTNFFTYIRDYKKNSIAQRGYNKKKRNDLRQICTSLLVTRNEYNIPVMHETYEGNTPDITHFKQVLPLIERRFKAIELELPKITLVFDKGNNSKDIFKFLDSKHIHFVSSVRPSMKIAKKLLDLPLSKYEELWKKDNGRKVFGYRTTTSVYLGKAKQNTLIVTFDEDTRALQEHNLDKSIGKAISELKVFLETKLNTKPQWKDSEKVALKINRDILKTKNLRAIIAYSLQKANNQLDLSWRIDDIAREECVKNFGKSILFSNRNEWSLLEIVKTYRAQIGVERQFKELNKRSRISVMPMYHWTDQKIRAHVFISVLALLLSNLLYRKIQLSEIHGSKDKCFEALEDIKEIHLNYDDDLPPDVVITQMSSLQRKLFKTLNLKRFIKK